MPVPVPGLVPGPLLPDGALLPVAAPLGPELGPAPPPLEEPALGAAAGSAVVPGAPMPVLLRFCVVSDDVVDRLVGVVVDWHPAASTAAIDRLNKMAGRVVILRGIRIPRNKREGAHRQRGKCRAEVPPHHGRAVCDSQRMASVIDVKTRSCRPCLTATFSLVCVI